MNKDFFYVHSFVLTHAVCAVSSSWSTWPSSLLPWASSLSFSFPSRYSYGKKTASKSWMTDKCMTYLLHFRNIGIVILVFGFITVFIALLYCTCICKESQRVAPDGNPYNVSRKMTKYLGYFFSKLVFRVSCIGLIIGKRTSPFLRSKVKTRNVGLNKTSSQKMN